MAEFLFAPAPNKEAAAFISGKPLVSRTVFHKLLPELKARAFTIAGIEAADVLQRTREALAELPQGGDWEEIKRGIYHDLSPYFVDPNEDAEVQEKQRQAAERRAELLLRTHGQQAYAAAQYAMLDEQRDLFPFWQYLSLGDEHVRETHAALDGVVLPADHEFWKGHFPPWQFGCRCQVVPLTDDDTAEIAAKEKHKPEDAKNVLNEFAQKDLTATRRLVRNGVTYNVSTPREEGKPGAYSFDPADLRMDLAMLQARYDAETWAAFSAWAKTQGIEELGTSVWDWLNGAVLQPAAMVSRSSPVSAAMDVIASGAHGVMITRTIATIDGVHDDGQLPRSLVHAHPSGDSLGDYDLRTHQIGIRESGPWPALTTCHETGHLLDHKALDAVGLFASESHPDLRAFRKAVDASEATQAIHDSVFSEGRRRYFLQRHEQFARAYAQYIAEKSGDPRLLADLARVRSVNEPWRQWSTEDFAPIKKALDTLFQKKGWL